jgi:O-acetyl-ADP-ribose deacetylase (regulator of RNase III)
MGESAMERALGAGRIDLVSGDITEQATDAIVNAANSTLLGGGGVDGAIHRVGGPEILEACRKLRATEWRDGLPAGEAVLTTAGRLPCRYVIHAVGPVWNGGTRNEAATLASCYRRSLAAAKVQGLSSIAFPSISTGAYGYPKELAAPIALGAAKGALEEGGSVTLVRFVLWSLEDLATWSAALAGL